MIPNFQFRRCSARIVARFGSFLNPSNLWNCLTKFLITSKSKETSHRMNELHDTKLKRPMDKSVMGGDVAALNALLGIINDPNITGAQVPRGVNVKATTDVISQDKSGATLPPSSLPVTAPAPITPPPSIPATVAPRNPQKIFYTGLMGAGKDYVAEQTDATIFGFADPLYHLAEYFFGITVNAHEGKDIPGVRAFLQAAGQWGRGEVSEQYPLTPARACVVVMVRSLGEIGRFDSKHCINWAEYGKNKDIWLEGVNRRVSAFLESDSAARVAITNVRFTNEFKRLQELGWTHYHIMCSPETRAKRVTVTNPKDVSEALATALNANVTKQISAQPKGSKLRVIWNDTISSPSSRMYSVAEFLREIAPSESPATQTMIVTGE